MSRHLSSPILALSSFLLLLAPTPAAAAPIQRAIELNLAVRTSLPLPAVFFSGQGVATVDVTGNFVNSLTIPAGILNAAQTTATIPNLEIQVQATNAEGSFTRGTGTFGGVMPINGNLRICLFGACASSPIADVMLPLNVIGAGGTTSASSIVISGAPWQTETVTLTTTGGAVLPLPGFQAGPGGMTGSTALPGGFLLFVSPARIELPGIGGIDAIFDLEVTFVPEPASLALVATAFAGLFVLARRRG